MDLSFQPYTVEEHIGLLEEFAAFFGRRFGVIAYLCCSGDISPSYVFPDSHIFFFDSRKELQSLFNRLGLTFRHSDDALLMGQLRPDLIILLNAVVTTDRPIRLLHKYGYFLCNDLYGSARVLRAHPMLRHVTAIHKEKNGKDGQVRYVADGLASELSEYWMPITTDAEFAERDSDGRLRYLIERYAPAQRGTLLSRYEALYERAKRRSGEHGCGERRTEYQSQNVFADPADPTSLLPPIPMKRGDERALHVFQKIT